jgi:predicted GIY-YIG superfamily endonuclease
MAPFTYVYILESQQSPDRHYVGLTSDLSERLRLHNTGHVSHTAKFTPWVLKTAIAVRGQECAAALERYLKTHAGRKFASAHFDGSGA